MEKNKYLTNQEIELLSNKIYNNLPLSDDKDLAEIYGTKFKKEVAEKLMLPEEEYIQLDGDQEHYILTSFGRLINTHAIRQIKTLFSGIHNIYYLNSTIMLKVSLEFKKNGWDYDREKIRKHFVDNNWTWGWIPMIQKKIDNGEGIPEINTVYNPKKYHKEKVARYR